MPEIDLRSDTVTKPTPEMRRAMYEAEVGDDVYGEDPTINRLQELAAELTGKEAALLVTSGTMGNQVAVMAQTQKGDEVILEADAHMFYYEVGGLACLSGVQTRTVSAPHGILTAENIRAMLRNPNDIHNPRTALICLENTHNRAGGTCYPVNVLAEIKEMAQQSGVPVHVDGARIFNASVALGVPVRVLAGYCDTMMFCLAKGLGAPVGSMLVGSKAFIDRARKCRKMLGGGMRQAGIIAAAGIVALTSMVGRLAEDHAHARMLGEACLEMGWGIDLSTVQTNIVVFDVMPFNVSAAAVQKLLAEEGVKVSQFGEFRLRMVTHYGITRQDIDYTIAALNRVAKKLRQDSKR